MTDSNSHMARARVPVSQVLVVDDDASFAAATAEIANLHGSIVQTAASLEAARTKLRQTRFDLVLLDLQLPDGNGLSLLDEIDLTGARIAIVTGNPSVDSAVRAIHLPVVDYLLKPLDGGALLALFAKAANPARGLATQSQQQLGAPQVENAAQDGSTAFTPARHASQISFRVGMTLEEVERQMLFQTMAYFNNHKPKAAQALGISLKTVYNRLARFGFADRGNATATQPGQSHTVSA